jgi:hypothetical protein
VGYGGYIEDKYQVYVALRWRPSIPCHAIGEIPSFASSPLTESNVDCICDEARSQQHRGEIERALMHLHSPQLLGCGILLQCLLEVLLAALNFG